ncbi:MAG: hypothetical protein G5Z42_00075 [Caldisphaeraceae archaeon]|nr:hypothetical protein [Caldisphaeraceae archaeon]
MSSDVKINTTERNTFVIDQIDQIAVLNIRITDIMASVTPYADVFASN